MSTLSGHPTERPVEFPDAAGEGSGKGALGKIRYVVKCGAHYFHFWDRNTYGEPQFGDLYWAKRYDTLSGCLSRVRALRRDGYDAGYHTDRATGRGGSQ